ncbi:hypothetical protein J7438_06390 [Thalassotalea sp. G20_0]|uniref:hypothetical protein n=1 Tax=Thalassotalea sp. G20_0 TaxID=2821093 RepID=UPI001ADB38F0|nr:hypothetical protein [Thalassotalea sp. G20_0]MBO9493713.1 hypothetical protein [Thalassotalea sp. G20_0]
MDPSMRNNCKLHGLEQQMCHYDDQLVECLLSYQPDTPDEQQELFIMCIWYLSLLVISDRGRSANTLAINRKVVALLNDGLIREIDKERARLRISCLYSADDPTMDDQRLSKILFGQIMTSLGNIRCHSLDIAKCEKLYDIVEQLVTSDPIFRQEQVAEDLLTQWQQIKAHFLELTTTTIRDVEGIRKDFMGSGEFDETCTIEYTFFCLGFWQSGFCSPDIGLIALQILYQNRSLPSVKELLVNSQKAACNDGQDNPALYALMEFLINYACEDSVARVENDDLRYYLKSLIFYLDGQLDKAIAQARLSRLPEAFWLLGSLQMSQENANTEEAIASIESAIIRGVEAGKLKLALLLLKSREPDLLKISGLLNDVMEHYGSLGAVKLQSGLAEVRDILELSAEASSVVNSPALNDDWLLSDDMPKRSSAVAPRNKNKGKRSKHKRAGSRGGKERSAADSHKTGRANKAVGADHRPTVDIPLAVVPQCQTQWLTQYDMAILSLSVTHAVYCRGYDQAYELLLEANGKVNWDFQQATIARLDLWRLRELANNHQHLQLLSQSVQAGEKTIEFSVIPQQSPLLGQFGLARSEPIPLTGDISVARDALRHLLIDKSLNWLCFLHAEPLALEDLKRRWQDHPLETAEQQLTDFEHSLSMVFTTASYLSMLGHLYGDIARDRDPADGIEEIRRIKALSAAFYQAANKFNEWRNRLRDDGELNSRIAKATPLGNLQKIRAKQGRTCREKIENQLYGDDHQLRTE